MNVFVRCSCKDATKLAALVVGYLGSGPLFVFLFPQKIMFYYLPFQPWMAMFHMINFLWDFSSVFLIMLLLAVGMCGWIYTIYNSCTTSYWKKKTCIYSKLCQKMAIGLFTVAKFPGTDCWLFGQWQSIIQEQFWIYFSLHFMEFSAAGLLLFRGVGSCSRWC